MKSLSISAPAKVNTILRVVGRRPDGFHDLEMVIVPLSLADEIELAEIPSGIEIRMTGQSDAGMGGEGNLAWRAASLLQKAADIKSGVRIDLRKQIPIAAGLGGGSSDAAAVLKGLNELWGLGWDSGRLARLGAKLGADVPFFCYRGPAFVEGVGDRISAIANYPKLSFLLINPGFAVSTPWVYKQWDIQHAQSEIEGNASNKNKRLTMKKADVRVRPPRLAGHFDTAGRGSPACLVDMAGRRGGRVRRFFSGFGDVVSSIQNDLEEVTISAYPEIAEIKEVLMNAGAAGALMSGSGPTVFGVFEDAAVRDRACELSAKNSWRVFAADSIGGC